MGLDLGGPADIQEKPVQLHADLPVPGAVVLDLEEKARVRLAVFNQRHREIFLRGPVSRVGHLHHLARPLHDVRLVLRKPQLLKRVCLPLRFLLPSVVRDRKTHLPVGAADALPVKPQVGEGSEILQRLLLPAGVGHGVDEAGDGQTVVELHLRLDPDAGHRIGLADRETAAVAVPALRQTVEPHVRAGRRRDIHTSLSLIGAVEAGQIDLGELTALDQGLTVVLALKAFPRRLVPGIR